MRIFTLAGVLAAAMPVAVGGQPFAPPTRAVTLSPGQMVRLAELAQQRFDLTTAFAVYSALESDPDSDIRAEARLRHAKELLALSRHKEAALLLRRLVDEKPEALVARLELAHALELLGDINGALREVRAAQASGLQPSVARLIDRYSAALRERRPFGASIEIAVAPDSNVNRATRSNTLGTIFGDFEIANEAKAKSGTGLSLRAEAFRRVTIGANASVLFRASGFANLYRQGRFNDIAGDLAVGPELSLGRDRLRLELGATQRWFGQKPYLRSTGLDAAFSHPLGPRTVVRLTGSAAILDNRLNDLEDGKSYSGEVEIERALTATTGIAASLSLDRRALKDPGYSTSGWRVDLAGWRDIGRMTFTLSGEIGRLRADERLLLFPDRRHDRYTRLSVGASFRQVQYAGFAPLIRFSIERNQSSIAFYDYRRRRTQLGIVRAF